MKNFFNQSGQEEGPFELLVAVIIMGFVIYIGMNALEELRIKTCQNKIDSTLENFKTALETTVQTLSRQELSFSMPADCFNENDEKITIDYINDERLCADYCGSSDKLCSLLIYRLKSKSGNQTFSDRKCLKISPNTSFVSQDSVSESVEGSSCENRGKETDNPKFELQDFAAEIPQGKYVLENVANPNSDLPVICAYLRQRRA